MLLAKPTHGSDIARQVTWDASVSFDGRSRSDNRRVAYHEGGHVFAAGFLLGFDAVRFATIKPIPAKNYTGLTSVARRHRDAAIAIKVSYAGIASETRLCQQLQDDVDPAAFAHDVSKIDTIATVAGLTDAEVQRLCAATRGLIRRHWTAVTTISRTLLRQHTLSGTEIADCLRKAFT